MRARLTAVLVGAAVVLVAAGLALYGRGQAAVPERPEPIAAVPSAPGDPGERIVPARTELAAAAAAGLVPADARSLLKVDRALHYGDFVWRDAGVPDGQVSIFVDLRTQMISVFRAGHEIGSAVILYGADDYDTPLGDHPIRGKERLHQSVAYDAAMPFTMWLTDDGVAIHASDVRRGRATHGCIGVPPAFAERLFAAAQVGDPVRVVRSPEPRGAAARS